MTFLPFIPLQSCNRWLESGASILRSVPNYKRIVRSNFPLSISVPLSLSFSFFLFYLSLFSLAFDSKLYCIEKRDNFAIQAILKLRSGEKQFADAVSHSTKQNINVSVKTKTYRLRLNCVYRDRIEINGRPRFFAPFASSFNDLFNEAKITIGRFYFYLQSKCRIDDTIWESREEDEVQFYWFSD